MFWNSISKKIYFSLFFLLGTIGLQAQYDFANTYLSFGYQTGYNSFNELNAITARYEAETANVNQSFKDFKLPAGLNIAIGGFYNFTFAEIGFTQRSLRKEITFQNLEDELEQTDVKFSMNSYYFALGAGGPIGDDLILGVGGSLELGAIRGKSRTGLENNIKDISFSTQVKETDLFSSVFIKIMLGDPEATRPKFVIQPYYTFGYGTANLTPLNRALNPDSYQNDAVPLRQNIGHFGIRFTMATFISY